MVSDSIANASIPSAAFSSKDLGKKKRVRTAKLKQCKLDVRREQWLSQGTAKNKPSKAEPNFTTTTTSTPTTLGTSNKENIDHHHRPLGNLEIRVERVEETIGGGGGGGSSILLHHHHHHPNDSDSESLSNSPTSLASGGNDSGTNFTGSTSSRSSTSTSSSFGGFCSESITDEDDDDNDNDGCLDDWEAVADALAAKDEQESQFPDPPPTPDPGHGAVAAPGRAWRPDDASRPQSLPNLSKQLSLPNSDRHQHQQHHQHHYGLVMMPAPSACPICTEDLDFTDSSFLPCLCGFRLCLFCYKRIIEDDGRCPGCRKPYELNPAQGSEIGFAFRLARSCSMITRS